jgi:acyl-ACP thioesterase
VNQCANETCTAEASRTYCSRRCQLTTRNVGHRGQLPDIWVSMDTERKLRQRASERGLSMKDLMLNIIEEAFNWEQIDLA